MCSSNKFDLLFTSLKDTWADGVSLDGLCSSCRHCKGLLYYEQAAFILLPTPLESGPTFKIEILLALAPIADFEKITNTPLEGGSDRKYRSLRHSGQAWP